MHRLFQSCRDSCGLLLPFFIGFLHQIRGYELRSGGMRLLHEMWVWKCHLHEIRGYFPILCNSPYYNYFCVQKIDDTMKSTTSSRLLKIIQAFIADHIPLQFCRQAKCSGQWTVRRWLFLHYYFLNTIPRYLGTVVQLYRYVGTVVQL